jgi:hypothetical protein
MYKRLNVYPDGSAIPASLPVSYQLSSYGEAPAGQSCFTCGSFDMVTRKCSKWDAVVKPRWWCAAWIAGPTAIVPKAQKIASIEARPYKRIATSIVEEHYSEQLVPRQSVDIADTADTIQVDVPLMIRLLEYAREDANSDVDLHFLAERLVELSEYGNTLDMANYDDIVGLGSKIKN